METNFTPLEFHSIETGVTYFRPRQQFPDKVQETDPAVTVMTDLGQVTAYTAELTTPLDKALESMVKRGVRMLLVRDADGFVRGLITSRDLEGKKPQKILEKMGGKREDLMVRDIMTLGGKLQVLMMEDVRQATVGDIIATLKAVNRQHTMVVDTAPDTGKLAVRGIFSLSQIGIRLGLDIDPSKGAITFAELDQARKKP